MNILTRRRFLRNSTSGLMGATMGALMNAPGLSDALATPGGTYNGKKLLFIYLDGGNDGLNTVVPGGDAAYYTSRPTLGIPNPAAGLTTAGQAVIGAANEGIDLGNDFAMLHPRMTDMVPVFNAGDLGVIHRVGYPKQSRSHFDSSNYWETGVPHDDDLEEGVFYRALTETGLSETQTLAGISFDSNLPLSLRGSEAMLNITNPDRHNLLGVYAAARQKHVDLISRAHALPHPKKNNRPLSFPTGERFVNSIEQVQAIDFAANDTAEFLDPANNNHLFPINSGSDERGFNSSSAYSFFRKLKNACQALADSDAVISGLSIGGFDTHNDQDNGDRHGDLLERVAFAFASARQYFTNKSKWDDVMVVTLSEFGRTSIENGSFGTDHAEASVMFAAGGAGFQGGVYNCDPNAATLPWVTGNTPTNSMFSVNGRYLSRASDYRSVLGEIFRKHLCATDEQLNSIIPGYSNPAEHLQLGGESIDGTTIRGELGLLT